MNDIAVTRLVVALSVAFAAVCIGWAFAVQELVPNACTYDTPPPNAQYVHCETGDEIFEQITQ